MTPDADTTQQGCASPSPDQRRMSAAYSTPGGREEREPTIVTRDVGERDVSSAEQGEGIVNGGGNNGGESTKKRKLSPPDERKSTGRGVANLTPEQLAKKRANDREAQRSIRQRTKLQIETLETRIRDLTNGGSGELGYQEKAHAGYCTNYTNTWYSWSVIGTRSSSISTAAKLSSPQSTKLRESQCLDSE
ncbi:hypothetical protein DID88_002806 [Monilinia fructigena]|uniref:BZIP domain-containing protein n=1 Tax=Monilinia fructigena TaxID=38457 RepID=A0A395IN79_9HELO|nr:hypothetical protein DID88_002806 [Monilinia fructigena]